MGSADWKEYYKFRERYLSPEVLNNPYFQKLKEEFPEVVGVDEKGGQ